MKKILVTTDFSHNSKAGIRFAIQLQKQSDFELSFFHSFHVKRPVSTNDIVFHSYERNEIQKAERKLKAFVSAVYRSSGLPVPDLKCVVKNSFVTDSTISHYAQENHFDFICISRRGEGKGNKLFGTNTTNLILYSKVAVMAIPPNYRRSLIRNFMYASDLSDLERELKILQRLTQSLKSKLQIVHLCYLDDAAEASVIVNTAVAQLGESGVTYSLEPVHLENTLAHNILDVVKQSKPSVLVMFTNQDQSFLDKLFFSGSTAKYSVSSPVPLVIFSKLKKS